MYQREPLETIRKQTLIHTSCEVLGSPPYLCSLIMKNSDSIPEMPEEHLQGSAVHVSPCAIVQVLLTAETDIAEDQC